MLTRPGDDARSLFFVSSKTIDNIGADGVALAAIQKIHSMLRERDAELNALRSEVADLRRILESRQEH